MGIVPFGSSFPVVIDFSTKGKGAIGFLALFSFAEVNRKDGFSCPKLAAPVLRGGDPHLKKRQNPLALRGL